MALILSVIVFVAIVLGVFAGSYVFDQRNARARLLRERLASAQKPPERDPNEELALLRDQMLSRIPVFDTFLRRSERASAVQKTLSQAGLKMRAGNFFLVSAGVALGVGLICLIWTLNPAVASAAMVIGGMLPYAYISYRKNKRFEEFEALFPEAIDTLARAVRAGHAFTTAIEMIADEIAEPIGGEFRKLFEEQKFGMPVREALMNLTERIPLVDVKFFVTAVMLQRETGGNLAEILDNLSYVIRERFKIMRQVRVHTAQGRLTMALLMGMPPAVVAILALLSPEFVQPLFKDPIGHTLLVGGITLQTIGYFVIKKIIRIQV